MIFLHKELSNGRWQTLSLAEQSSIGSEVSRAKNWQGKDEKLFQGATERDLELFDLTLEDARWRRRLREINRAREVFCDTILRSKEHSDSLIGLDKYFLEFASAARKNL